MNLIIDTDMGIDDAVALLMVLAGPDIHLEAITTVLGNVPVDQATLNTGVVLEIAQASACPLYKGCGKPLLQYPAIDAMEYHGRDGLGGAGRAASAWPVAAEHASLALTRLVAAQPGTLTLLTLGPLTNIALAIRLMPAFVDQLDRLVVMAGAVEAKGNTTSTAEFNIAVDPEAAGIVFDACHRAGKRLELITWETTLDHPTPLDDWEQMIAGTSEVARLVQSMTDFIKRRAPSLVYRGVLWPDPLAAAVAAAPDIVVEKTDYFIEIATQAGPAKGQTIADYRYQSPHSPNATVVRRIDMGLFHEMLRAALI